MWRDDSETAEPWTKWRAALERLPTGNRPLVRQEGLYRVAKRETFLCQVGGSYSMPNRMFHRTTVITDVVVTLMTKTAMLSAGEFSASVLCSGGLEPDQEFSRFQVPFEDLETIMVECLMGTPFEGLRPWHDPQ